MEYVVNQNAQIKTGYHKIHTKDCPKGPKEGNRIDLKQCICPMEAKSRAKEYFASVNGCKHCCKEIFYKK